MEINMFFSSFQFSHSVKKLSYECYELMICKYFRLFNATEPTVLPFSHTQDDTILREKNNIRNVYFFLKAATNINKINDYNYNHRAKKMYLKHFVCE